MFRRAVDETLEIRQVQRADADAIFAAVERDRNHLREWLPWVDQTHSSENIRAFISRVTAQFEAGQGPNTGIWLEGRFVGSIGCHPIDWANRSASIGYWMEAGLQGKGIMTRCCATLVKYLFEEVLLHRVEIRCGTGNYRSCAIPKRLGFTCVGVLPEAEWVNDRWVDLMIWSLLDWEWRSRP